VRVMGGMMDDEDPIPAIIVLSYEPVSMKNDNRSGWGLNIVPL
jgi:hypothetical protein